MSNLVGAEIFKIPLFAAKLGQISEDEVFTMVPEERRNRPGRRPFTGSIAQAETPATLSHIVCSCLRFTDDRDKDGQSWKSSRDIQARRLRSPTRWRPAEFARHTSKQGIKARVAV
jgi:hypothetical protein